MPGLGAPEFLAALVLGLFLFHNYLIGLAEWTDIILVVSGLALILVEIFLMPGTIVPGASGGVLLFLGLLLAMQDFVFPTGGIQLDVFRHNLTVLLLILLGAPLLGMFLMRRFTRTRAGSFLSSSPSADFAGSVTGRGAILPPSRVEAGARGRALTPLRPAGRVEIDGEPHDARSSGAFLPAGAAVRVLEQRGATLLVTALPVEEDDA